MTFHVICHNCEEPTMQYSDGVGVEHIVKVGGLCRRCREKLTAELKRKPVKVDYSYFDGQRWYTVRPVKPVETRRIV